MSRYIDAEYNLHDLWCYFDFSDEELTAISTVLKLIPTADVVEVVRCKDCKHYKFGSDKIRYCFMNDSDHLWQDDDYCSYGERREDDKR